jgi:hypothetical protein
MDHLGSPLPATHEKRVVKRGFWTQNDIQKNVVFGNVTPKKRTILSDLMDVEVEDEESLWSKGAGPWILAAGDEDEYADQNGDVSSESDLPPGLGHMDSDSEDCVEFWNSPLDVEEGSELLAESSGLEDPELLVVSDGDSSSDGDVDTDNEDDGSDGEYKADRAWKSSGRKKVTRPCQQPAVPLLRKDEKRTKGSRLRRRYDHRTEARTVAWVDSKSSGLSSVPTPIYKEASQQLKISSAGLVRKWCTPKERDRISSGVAPLTIADFAPDVEVPQRGGRGKRAPGKATFSVALPGRRPAKYVLAETQTIEWCRLQRRIKKNKVTTRLLRIHMLKAMRHHYPGGLGSATFKASGGWLKRFMGRYGLKFRRRNDTATKPTAELIPRLCSFINKLRILKIRNPAPGNSKHGKYNTFSVLNVDQVPLPFASNDPRTIALGEEERVQIRSSGGGHEKRQATLQLAIRPEGVQPFPHIIFRGAAVYKNRPDLEEKRRLEVAQ